MKHASLWLAATLSLTACTTSPTGRSQFIPLQQDLSEQGASSFAQLKEEEKVSADPLKNSYVQCVAARIVAQVPEHYGFKPEQWEVVVFDSPQINAFALPGAKIGVYTGLLEVAKDQDQLASVLGHEVGHVLAKHANERMSHQMLAGLATVAAGAALSDSENKGIYLTALGVGATYGFLLPYSRTHESEADVIGQELMASAGFNPQGAVQMWQNMAAVSESKTPELLSTHPSPQSRIEKLERSLARFTPLYEQAKQQGRRPDCGH